MEKMKNNQYSAESIQILEGLEAVRKRPGMYIGSTGSRGLHHLVWEIVDNAIDEAMAGFCDTITIEILKGNIIRVNDNGRGIPVDEHQQSKRPAVETIFTVLHAGGKFDGKSYKVAGGLHGVGGAVVNALSVNFKVTIARDEKLYEIEFKRGEVVRELEVVGKSTHTGSTVEFLADPLVFTETTKYDYETLRNRVQELAFLNKGLNIKLIDSREEEIKENSYHYEVECLSM